MINALHLLWIIPLSAMLGYAVACLMILAKKYDEEIKQLDPELKTLKE